MIKLLFYLIATNTKSIEYATFLHFVLLTLVVNEEKKIIKIKNKIIKNKIAHFSFTHKKLNYTNSLQASGCNGSLVLKRVTIVYISVKR